LVRNESRCHVIFEVLKAVVHFYHMVKGIEWYIKLPTFRKNIMLGTSGFFSGKKLHDSENFCSCPHVNIIYKAKLYNVVQLLLFSIFFQLIFTEKDFLNLTQNLNLIAY
jgi:hypothetical protein